jgi:hypothetical protein
MKVCTEMEQELSAYLEGVISPEERKRIDDHLAGCVQCTRALGDLKKTRELLQNLPEVEAPPWFTQKVMARVRAEAKSQRSMFQRLIYPLHVKIPIEVLATCIIAVVVLYVYKNIGPEATTLREPQVRPPQESHIKPPAVPREFAIRPQGKPSPQTEAQTGTTDAGSDKVRQPVKEEIEAGAPADRTDLTRKEGPAPMAAPSLGTASEKADIHTPRSVPAEVLTGKMAKKKDAFSYQYLEGTNSALPPVALHALLRVRDTATASEELERDLKLWGARKVTKELHRNGIMLKAELPGPKAKDFLDALEKVGKVETTAVADKLPQEYIAIHIEIIDSP